MSSLFGEGDCDGDIDTSGEFSCDNDAFAMACAEGKCCFEDKGDDSMPRMCCIEELNACCFEEEIPDLGFLCFNEASEYLCEAGEVESFDADTC